MKQGPIKRGKKPSDKGIFYKPGTADDDGPVAGLNTDDDEIIARLMNESVSMSDIQRALYNYEQDMQLPKDCATVRMVDNSSAGIRGWARARIRPRPKIGEYDSDADPDWESPGINKKRKRNGPAR